MRIAIRFSWTLAGVLAAAIATAPEAMAETVNLRSGATLSGDVKLEGAEGVVVKARFPEEKTYNLKRADLAPESLYEVLERRVEAADAKAHAELGGLAERLGFHGAAIAEYRAVKALDPSSAKDMDAAVGRVRESLAASIVEDAQDELDGGRPLAAIRYLHTVIEKYPDTKAAGDAKALMEKAHEAAGRAAGVAEVTVPAAQAQEVLDTAGMLLEKADEVFTPLRGHGGSTVKDQRIGERALRSYEAAWAQVRRLPVALEGKTGADVQAVRDRARRSLVDAYLTLGTIFLQRRALPSAEEYCNRACELDPESKDSHDLHRLIIEARAFYYGYGSSRGR